MMQKKKKKGKYLRSKNDSTLFQEEGEVAGKIETSSEPLSRRNIQLCPSFVGKGLEIKNGILKGKCVQRFPITNSTKLSN